MAVLHDPRMGIQKRCGHFRDKFFLGVDFPTGVTRGGDALVLQHGFSGES